MSKNPKIHISCGEFAKITGTTKETLFHYDNKGVLVPDFRDENGYRYYSIYQIEYFQVIALLKELGMSLKGIKKYLDKKTPLELISLLKSQKAVLNKKLQHLTKMKQLIDAKVAITKTALSRADKEIVIEYFDEMPLAITMFDKNVDDRALILQMAKHIKACEEKSIYSPYPIGEVLPTNAARENKFDFDCYSYCYTYTDKKLANAINIIRPAGIYLNIYSYNGYSPLPNAYVKMLAYADENDLTLGEDIYEDVMLDELSVHGYDQLMFRLSVKIISQTK